MSKPIDMILNCPKCGLQHIDAPNPKHDLYANSDTDKPKSILDSNGEVVLGLCKRCGRAESELDEPCWTNPAHKSHLCGRCGCIWRPADVETNGVPAIVTRGQKDNWPPPAIDPILVAIDTTIDAMIKVNGETFHCTCGCNVFRRTTEGHYKCNSCSNRYAGE